MDLFRHPRLTEPLKQLSELPPVNPYQVEMEHTRPDGGDKRPHLEKPVQRVSLPHLNLIYDTLRSQQGWRYMADALIRGTITTTVNATTTANVAFPANNAPQFRLEQWPGAVQVYLAVRSFGIVPQAIPTANGGMECIFTDQFGNQTPLGEFLCQTGGNVSFPTIMPTPITDPSALSVGTLSVTQSNVATSNGTFNWMIGLSAVYLLPSPARHGYELVNEHEHNRAKYRVNEGDKHTYDGDD